MRLALTHPAAVATFDLWVDDRSLPSIGTNHGSRPVAFQGWQKFKEAFAPELILRATDECKIPVRRVLDPFGGSGTTGLAAQFLGYDSVLVEVNPYLADLIEAKLTHYDLPLLRADVDRFIENLAMLACDDRRLEESSASFSGLPPTFVEPGVNSRWIFSRRLAGLLYEALELAGELSATEHARLVRVAIGGALVGLSNVRVSGKGRRYRNNWQSREPDSREAAKVIEGALRRAVDDVERFQPRSTEHYELIRGDARAALQGLRNVDLAVFSPPYPNSFDYTDVYNVELWMLGYLTSAHDNRTLRVSTLSSHVQIQREFSPAPTGSTTLEAALAALKQKQSDLWDSRLPDMVGAYFADMYGVISSVGEALSDQGEIWMVVGDSRYSGIDVRVADILVELAPSLGFELVSQEPFRSMRASPQQGGALELAESLVVLRKA